MRLKHIRVTKLFGLFNHSIPLRLIDRITIIHGPNGVGKTAVLQMLEALLNNQVSTLKRIPFASFTVEFEGNAEIQVNKQIHPKVEGEKEENKVVLEFILKEAGKSTKSHKVEFGNSRERSTFPLDYIERHVQGLEQIGPETWLQVQTGRRLDLEDVFEIYQEVLPMRGKPSGNTPAWLKEFRKQFDVRLIQAQRLINLSSTRRGPREAYPFSFEPSVSSYSRELAAQVQEKQANYGTFSQQLDSTFPTRVLQQQLGASASADELTRKLAELEQRRQRIIDAGLLTKEPHVAPTLGPGRQVDESTKGILSLYAADVENKLQVFDELTGRIELFKELINKRFSYKRLDVERERGFQLSSSTGLSLMPTDLSSGEQHELVLLYELLFRTKPNALILIDEPELSLHVAWQVEFLMDLERVIKLSSFDVLLATHSPQIVNNRWDLTEKLEGP
jgi:predicted ATP-dependent endonuclease of OLD family